MMNEVFYNETVLTRYSDHYVSPSCVSTGRDSRDSSVPMDPIFVRMSKPLTVVNRPLISVSPSTSMVLSCVVFVSRDVVDFRLHPPGRYVGYQSAHEEFLGKTIFVVFRRKQGLRLHREGGWKGVVGCGEDVSLNFCTGRRHSVTKNPC